MTTGIGDSPQEYSWPLYSVIAEICDRAGVPVNAVNFDTLDDAYVDGFSATYENEAYTYIAELANIFFFDPTCFAGKLHFKQRGGDPVATISTDEMIDDGEDIVSLTRKDDMSIPRVLHFKYFEVDGSLTTNMQTSDRSVDNRSKSESAASTTVILNADDAIRTAIIRHKVAVEEQRGEYNFSLPDSYLYLTVGDIVTINDERLRINEIQIDDGFQTYKCSFDRQSAYTCDVVGAVAKPATAPRTTIIGTTVLNFIDSHILKDADDRLGYYVAITGAGDRWTGAQVDLSFDGGATYVDSYSGNAESIAGVVTVGCGAASRYTPDSQNTITVKLLRTAFELESATLTQMMNRSNLAIIGNELVNFGNVNEISPGVWEISYFLRGRKGSEISAHLAGERFVLLDRPRLYFIDAELYQLNRQLTFRATSYGNTTTTATQTVSFTGQSQTERAPEYLTAYRVGGNVVISWQGCGKLGGGVNIGMGQYFTGYRVTINGVSQTTTNESLTITDSESSYTISVSQLNSITGAGPAASISI